MTPIAAKALSLSPAEAKPPEPATHGRTVWLTASRGCAGRCADAGQQAVHAWQATNAAVLQLAALNLTAEERQVLEGWARRRQTAQALAGLRAHRTWCRPGS